MKKALLISNLILIALVGYLYYLQFRGHDKERPVPEPVARTAPEGTTFRIAYVDLDSLQNNYGYYKKLKADFERKQAAANDQITDLQKKYQARAMQLQQKGSSMTPAEQEAAMQEIGKMQQDLQEKKQEIDNDLYNQNSKMKDDILNRLEDFLKQYNRDGRYSYIFSYEPGFMFYKDSALNITTDVISGLNQAEAENKK